MTRQINFIVVHHTTFATATVDTIRQHHVERKGWSDIGYHAVVHRDGTLHPGRPVARPGAHTRNPARETPQGQTIRALMPGSRNSGNNGSLGIVACGNMNILPVTHDQVHRIIDQCATWCKVHDIDPQHIYGHRDFQTSKLCPGHSLYAELPHIRQAVARRIGA